MRLAIGMTYRERVKEKTCAKARATQNLLGNVSLRRRLGNLSRRGREGWARKLIAQIFVGLSSIQTQVLKGPKSSPPGMRLRVDQGAICHLILLTSTVFAIGVVSETES